MSVSGKIRTNVGRRNATPTCQARNEYMTKRITAKVN